MLFASKRTTGTNLFRLLLEDGERWMSVEEQRTAFPNCSSLYPTEPRPVWLVLSLYLCNMGYRFSNGLGVKAQMRNMRAAVHDGDRG